MKVRKILDITTRLRSPARREWLSLAADARTVAWSRYASLWNRSASFSRCFVAIFLMLSVP